MAHQELENSTLDSIELLVETEAPNRRSHIFVISDSLRELKNEVHRHFNLIGTPANYALYLCKRGETSQRLMNEDVEIDEMIKDLADDVYMKIKSVNGNNMNLDAMGVTRR